VHGVIEGTVPLHRAETRKFANTYNQFSAGTVVLMDESGRALKYRAAMQGPEREDWQRATHEEWVRLLNYRVT
jgi:hypothetical protein